MKLMNSINLEHELTKLIRSVDTVHFEERTFGCRFCEDTGFVLRTDQHGRVWGRKCDCLMDAIAANRANAPQRRGKAKAGDDIPF